jgi:hypothetical protein
VVPVATFGLLHGIGFAGPLRDLASSPSEFPKAILGCTLGFEGAQFAAVALAFFLVRWQNADRSWYRARIAAPASLVMASVAVFLMMKRILS